MPRAGDPTRRAFRRSLAAEGAACGFVLGLAFAAASILAVRALASPESAWTPSLLALVPSASLLGALLNLRRTPSPEVCAALTEDATRAGGLLLVRDVPGSDAWPSPEPVAASAPPRLRRHLAWMPAAAAALAFALAAPSEWFAAAAPAAPQAFPDITADLRNALDDIREEGTLEPETVEEIAEEIRRIEASADPCDPGAALDAADRLRERVAALLELGDAAIARMAKDRGSFADVAASPEAAEEFRKMLGESCAGSCPCGEERPGDGCEGGECEGAGSGEPDRGRGDAAMSWTDPSELGDSKYVDGAREAVPGDRPDEVRTGESVSPEDPAAKELAPARGEGAAPGGISAGTSVNRRVAPAHRAAVRRFFESERKPQ